MVEPTPEEWNMIDQTIMDLLDAIRPEDLDAMAQSLKDEIASCQQFIAGQINNATASPMDQGTSGGPGG